VKVLVVAPQPFLTPRGTPLSVYYRTMVMAEHGATIDLLSYGEGEDVEIPGVNLIRIPRMAWVGPVAVGPSWKKLFLDVVMVVWTVGLLARHRYDAVHAHEESVFWCRFLKPLFRFRLIYDMHSSLPQQLSNFQFSKSRALLATFRALEHTCLRKADAVITICPDLRDYALRTGVAPEKHLLIENSIFEDVRLKRLDAAAADAAAPAVAKNPPLDTARPIILYAGTFEHYQGIDMLIRAFAVVVAQRTDAQLLLVGGTPQQVAHAATIVAELGLGESVHLTGRLSKNAAMRYTRLANVLVSPRLDGTNTPLKIYEQMASGKPLVATRIWSHTQVLNETVCILVEPGAKSLAQGILQAINDPDGARQVAARARALYEQQYARPVYEQKIRRLLEIVS
jgi:glycosyltransferase involved in cell wall biosynthesis